MSKNKQSQMMSQLFIVNFLDMMVYIISKDYGTTLIVFGITLRSILFIRKEKSKTNTIFLDMFFYTTNNRDIFV